MTTMVRVGYQACGIETGHRALPDWIGPWTPR